nr:hypothetical protein [Tanacetum cinerariifolium]
MEGDTMATSYGVDVKDIRACRTTEPKHPWLEAKKRAHAIEGILGGRSSKRKTTTVPRFVMEHQLKTYPMAKPKVQMRRCLNPDQRRVLKEKVFEWLKAGSIRRFQYPRWVTNVIQVKRKDGTWQVHTDVTTLNKICPKDMYPFPVVKEKLGSIIGYLYKCFLRPLKEGSQIWMSEEDEEKWLSILMEECSVTLTCQRD